MNNNDKSKLIKKIEKVTDKYLLYEIFKLIDNITDKYTINSNGIFINIENIPDNILIQIDNFIKYTTYTNKILNNNKIEIDKETETETNKTIEKVSNKINKNKIYNVKIEYVKFEVNEPFNLILKKCKEIDKENTYEYK
tara:strand:+ start:718 stop:1134 length:417 start_codon:yes stop_codon:yes gene_type:complete